MTEKVSLGRAGVRDVAQEAGVSLGTVSNVLNHPDKVSPRTRGRVQTVIADLGFIPSSAAGQLRGRRSRLIGVVVPDVGNPYWASVLRGIEKVCDEAHMGMIVSSTHQDKKKQKNVLRLLKSQGVDGLIIAPIDVLSHEYAEFGSILGTVAIGETHAVRAVGSDGKEGAFAAALHLLELGHKEIGLVNGRDFVSWCRARREGVVEAFEKFGYSPKECLHTYVVDDMTTHEGERAAKHLLEESNRATGIICANDMLALGVLLESRRRGVSVPDELSIVGYDDVDFSSALNPALTTVRQPSYELGKRVAHVLLGEEEDSTTILDTNLVVRDSTAPPQTKCNSQ